MAFKISDYQGENWLQTLLNILGQSNVVLDDGGLRSAALQNLGIPANIANKLTIGQETTVEDTEAKAKAKAKPAQTDYQALINALSNTNAGQVGFTGASAKDLAGLNVNATTDTQMLNAILNSGLVDKTLSADTIQSMLSGADVSSQNTLTPEQTQVSYLMNALANNEVGDIETNFQQRQLLAQIAKDPSVLTNVTSALRAANDANLATGSTAVNALNAAGSGNEDLAARVAEVYSGGLTNADLAKTNIVEAGKGATTQTAQDILSRIQAANQNNSTRVANYSTLFDQVSNALSAEAARNTRLTNDSAELANRNADTLTNRVAGAATTSTANADAQLSELLAGLDIDSELKQTLLANAGNANARTTQEATLYKQLQDILTKANNTSVVSTAGATRYDDPNARATYADESILSAIQSNPEILKQLDPAQWQSLLNRTDADSLAAQYGADYMTDANKLADMYKGYYAAGNDEYTNRLNAAQKAYIAAVQNQDAKTAQALARLANSSSGAKQGMYGATMLTNQMNQQRNNSGMAMGTIKDELKARAQAVADQTTAATEAQKQVSSWVNSGNSGTYDLTKAVTEQNQNASNMWAAGNKLTSNAVAGQSSLNDVISKAFNTTQNARNQAGNAVTSANANIGANNANNAATLNTAKAKAAAQLALEQYKKKYSK